MPYDPPPDAAIYWIPGPAGSLRVCERHRNRRCALPLVFVHGLAGRLEHWSAQLTALGPARCGIAIDLPGHGGSDVADDGDYSIPALAAAIAAVTDGLHLRRLVLVAHSLGATAAIEYAGAHRHRVAGLLLVDPSGDQSRMSGNRRARYLESVRRDPGGEMTWNFRHFLGGARAEVAERVLNALAATPEEVLLGVLEGASAYSPLPALERYGGPLRSVISAFNKQAFSLHRLVPELPVSRIERASHWLMMDKPEELAGILEDFLARVPAPPP
ncbi:MAG: alpha/beta fold hydrolase [bacterium]|nr:alpha/beta fold hydrolase [bacterium]